MAWSGLEAAFLAGAAETAAALGQLGTADATALPLLPPAWCARLRDAAADLAFRTAKREVGSAVRPVRQDFEICMAVPDDHALHGLRRALERHLNAALGLLARPPLAQPIRLNDLVVQRYRRCAFGITAHRDHVRYVGLVALVQLSGTGRFFVCADRAGTGAREVSAGPGDVLLLRAPGFEGRTDRPFHYLHQIGALRYSVGLRHDSRAVA